MFHTPPFKDGSFLTTPQDKNGFPKAKKNSKKHVKNKPTTIIITIGTNQNESKRTSQLHACV
jgi:hypothetical protein